MIYGTVKSFEYIYERFNEMLACVISIILAFLAHLDGLSIDKSSPNGRTWHLNVAL